MRVLPMKQGLLEWVIVTGFLALAAGGAVALFGDELREALGLRPPPAASGVGTPPPAGP